MRYAVIFVVALLLLTSGGFVWYAWHGAIAPIEPPAHATFAPAAIARGAQLAALGDCISCHTTAGGAPFAGGRAVQTPFGAVYASNITPDPKTGIGRWSEAAFRRATAREIATALARRFDVDLPRFPRQRFDTD